MKCRISLLSIVIFFCACVSKKSSFVKDGWTIENDRNTRRIVWYKILQPVKNTGKGWLYIKTDEGNIDTSEMNVNQLALASSLLETGNVLYNDSTNNIIVVKELLSDVDSLSPNKIDTTVKRPF